ncbi:MAG: ribbon-helix-helix domain-containing protein [Verrucomicrobiia bacterium]
MTSGALIWHTPLYTVSAAGKNQKFLLTFIYIEYRYLACEAGWEKAKGKLLSVWVSRTLLLRLDEGAKKENADRSQFIRNAVREKLLRHGGAVGK